MIFAWLSAHGPRECAHHAHTPTHAGRVPPCTDLRRTGRPPMSGARPTPTQTRIMPEPAHLAAPHHPSMRVQGVNMLTITRRVYATDLMTGATIAYLLRDGRIVG